LREKKHPRVLFLNSFFISLELFPTQKQPPILRLFEILVNKPK